MRARLGNRRTLGVALVATAALVLFSTSAMPVFSADSGTVTATVTAAAPCLTISGAASVDFGTGAFSSAQSPPTELTKPVGTSTLTNCSGAGEQILARATDATGDAIPPAVWTLALLAHPCSGGVDKFAAATRDAAGSLSLDAVNSPFVNLGPDESRGVGFSILMPCTGSSGAGQAMSFTYVYTAAQAAADDAVYVSLTGNDTNNGSILSPKRTVAAGVAAAETSGHLVKVAAGIYDEGTGVAAADGVSILGGYDPTTWSRSPTAITRIDGSPQAVLADGDTGVVLDGLVLRATAGGSSLSAYGIRAINGSSLDLVNVDVAAANGAVGPAAPSAGANGASGANSLGGGGGSCDGDASPGAGGAGGGSAIGRTGGNGGLGGSPAGNPSGANGGQGAGGTPGGAGGLSGDPGGTGGNGVAGASGAPGAAGAGGPAATQPSATWSGSDGGAAAAGGNGNGGGGGGGGGAQIGTFVDDGSGNGGGGGGAGGQGGGGGLGGQAGGGSFGVYLFDSTVTVNGSTLTAGNGGNGGAASAGGNGGAGGAGGAGGNVCTLEVGRGGNGGSGGSGGAGGQGGGGAGGPSVALFRRGTSSATVATSALSFGTGGQGGTPNGATGVQGSNLAG